MKINFSEYDLTSFLTREGVFCGIWSKLIQPNHIGTKFNRKNKIFRSSVWNDTTGELLSGSYPKFVNWGENPDNFPPPSNIRGWTFVEKIDGSACIVDYINSQFVARTRGTFTYKDLDNHPDFTLCFEKYPKIKEFLKNNPHYSLLLEIVTPNLRIVLNYGEIDFYLCGCVNKNDYSLLLQSELDEIAKELGLKRPIYYTFSSIENLLDEVEKWKGKEGIVGYSPDGQLLLKVKSDWYKKLHAAKDNFRSIEAVIDVWFSFGEPDYNSFVSEFTNNYDYETLLICQGFISIICDGAKEVKKIVDYMGQFVEPLRTLPRKDAALKIIGAYGDTNRGSFLFKLLDNKPLSSEDRKKLMYQVLKK